MPRTVIAAQTAAVTTKMPVQFNDLPATIFATNLGAAEEIPVYSSHDGGSTWETLYLDGLQVKLTNTNKATTIYGPLHLAVTKPVTAAAVGIYTSDAEDL